MRAMSVPWLCAPSCRAFLTSSEDEQAIFSLVRTPNQNSMQLHSPLLILLASIPAKIYQPVLTPDTAAKCCLPQYYDLPRLSWRALTWEAVARGRPGWGVPDILEGDERHPAILATGAAVAFASKTCRRWEGGLRRRPGI